MISHAVGLLDSLFFFPFFFPTCLPSVSILIDLLLGGIYGMRYTDLSMAQRCLLVKAVL